MGGRGDPGNRRREPGPGAIVGRRRELDTIDAFLDGSPAGARLLLLEGEPGIGKTTLWSWALERSRRGDGLAIVARPAEAESLLPFAALNDLLEDVADDVLPALSDPQRRALDLALLRASPAVGDASDRVAPYRAVASVLRALSDRSPLTIAIDDVQWLDHATAGALAFASRRIPDRPVRFVLARRGPGGEPLPLDLDRALPPEGVHRLQVGPLSVEEIADLLRSRLETSLPRPTLVALHRMSGGNPLYALAIARATWEREGGPTGPRELRVPEGLGAILRERLDSLSKRARRAVLLTAASAHPTGDLLGTAGGSLAGLEEAIEADVLVPDGERIRFTHPLLASVAYDAAPPWERRDAHRRLAGSVADPEEQALHRALATQDDDGEVAAELEQAARRAASRGAPDAAARLAEHAARLTPGTDQAGRRRRLVTAAENHLAAGDPALGRSILEGLVEELPAGPERAAVLWRLADAVGDDLGRSVELCRRALEEAGDDPRLGAEIRLALGTFAWLQGDLRASAGHVEEAARLAERAGDDALLAMALAEVGHAQTVLGWGMPRELLDRAVALEPSLGELPAYLRPSFQLGVLLTYTDQLEQARPLLSEHLDRVTRNGDESARAGVLFRLTELELRAGRWADAYRYVREAAALAGQTSIEQEQAAVWSVLGAVQAHLGQVDEARESAVRGLRLAEEGGDTMVALRCRGVLGFLELSRGRPSEAHVHLGPATDRLLEIGVGEFSISAVIHNEVEALVALGELGRAGELVEALTEAGRRTDRSWSLAMAARGRALIAAAEGRIEEALAGAEEALALHDRLPQPFERARAVLIKGTIERRAKRRADSRRTLNEALESFDRLGAALWAERTAGELARVGGRAPGGRDLTPTERRVAELVAEGRSNAEVAAALFMAVRSVEWNLSKVYAKLGVRSRAELAHRLRRDSDPRAD